MSGIGNAIHADLMRTILIRIIQEPLKARHKPLLCRAGAHGNLEAESSKLPANPGRSCSFPQAGI